VQRIPEHQFRAVGTDKFMWKLIVVYLPIAGGMIWLCTKRKVVRAAAALAPRGGNSRLARMRPWRDRARWSVQAGATTAHA